MTRPRGLHAKSHLGCLQIPLLYTAVGAVSLLDHPGLATGGTLWFPDLTASALSWSRGLGLLSQPDVALTAAEVASLQASVAPMGPLGALLPMGLYLTLNENFSNSVRAGHSLTLAAFGGARDADARVGVQRTVVRIAAHMLR